MYDSIIIGKGPAGLSAALYLGREGYKVLIIGLDSILEKVNGLENYIGLKSISGPDLLYIAQEQVKDVGVNIKKEKVLNIQKQNEGFVVLTNENSYSSKSIVLALGAKKSNARLKDAEQFVGKGISYCVACDGFFYKDKTVGVIGSSEYAIEEALNLKNYTEDITIFTNGKEVNLNERYAEKVKEFKVDNRKIIAVEGEEELTNIVMEDNEKVSLDGAFISNETPNIDDLANNLGIISDNKKIVLDENYMTSIEGVFACGDMVNNFKQVTTAVGSGAMAANSCIKYLINLK